MAGGSMLHEAEKSAVDRSPVATASAAAYAAIGVAFAVVLIRTMVEYPLFPLQTDSASWASAWFLL